MCYLTCLIVLLFVLVSRTSSSASLSIPATSRSTTANWSSRATVASDENLIDENQIDDEEDEEDEDENDDQEDDSEDEEDEAEEDDEVDYQHPTFGNSPQDQQQFMPNSANFDSERRRIWEEAERHIAKAEERKAIKQRQQQQQRSDQQSQNWAERRQPVPVDSDSEYDVNYSANQYRPSTSQSTRSAG